MKFRSVRSRDVPMRLAAVLALALSGCLPPPSGSGFDRPTSASPSEQDASERRLACGYGRGSFPSETIGHELPLGDDAPFDHIVVLMLENRSFDHYFATLPGVDGSTAGALPAGNLCVRSPNHSWIGTHTQMNGGRMDGFARASEPDGARAVEYLTAADLPYYHALYRTFAMSDRHFSGLPGPTWINRYMLLAGTSYGMTENMVAPPDRIAAGSHLFAQLDRAGVGWRVYFTDVPFALGAFPVYAAQRLPQFRPVAQFFRDVAAGSLTGFVLIEPGYLGKTRTDEHSPANPQWGQAFTASIVAAVMSSPAWERTVLIITYDEHGGFYDHVPPPVGCDPGDYPLPPSLPGSFAERGPRVPLVIVSPWARRGYVSHRPTDAASVLRFVAWRFGLPALTGRDANAWPLLDMFDFCTAPRLDVPELPEAVVEADACW